MEEWKPVKDFEHYLVSTHGICKNTRTGKFIGSKTGRGYIAVCLYDKRRKKTRKMHQLVCEAFKPNPMSYTYTVIDHIDEDKTNNHVSNLQRLTKGQNNMRSSKHKGYYKTRWGYIPRIYIDGKFIHFPTCKTSDEARQVYLEARADAMAID